jgi:uncharacterized protein YegL
MAPIKDYINHVALVLDASGSMRSNEANVIKVANDLVANLHDRAKELKQETRLSIYTFGNKVDCRMFDRDVARIETLTREHYSNRNEQTALLEAMVKALNDFESIPQQYGDHAFLVYALTDGEENCSKRGSYEDMQRRLQNLQDNVTLGVFAPNQKGVHAMKMLGIPAGNISVWDTASSSGVREVGNVMTQATNGFMRARATGVRRSSNLFDLNVTALQSKTLEKLQALRPGQFRLLDVPDVKIPIATFVERITRRPYRLGEAFYQLTKAENIQPQKQVAIYARGKHTVYTGVNARDVLGLPHDFEVRVNPASTPDYDIFVQSTSVNRNLFEGSKLLLLG